MTRIRRTWLERSKQERGAVLIISAATLVVLMGAAAMGTDLGWLYLNGLRTQNAADAAALAGVVYLPDDEPTAQSVATSVAAANKYVDTSLGGNAAVWSQKVPINERQLEVEVTRSVDTFFLRVFGIQRVSIMRRAVAEYVLPLPIGSPDPQFGNDPECAPNINPTPPSSCSNFWANIHGKYTNRVNGDAFSSFCDGNKGPGCTENDWWRETGYIYGVEVDGGPGTLTIDLLDPAFVQGGNDNINAGDNPQDGNAGPTVRFRLYDADPTPLDLSDNAVLCSVDYSPEAMGAVPFDWRSFCSVSISGSGVYPLQVVVVDEQYGLNRFSMRASYSSGSARLYGIGDMSIYANVKSDGSSPARFYLAEVDDVHAGKPLVVELFDPGDAKGSNLITIKDPFGASPPCRIVVEGDGIDRAQGSCVIDTTRPANDFNGDWVEVRIDLPTDYTCNGSNCWWTIEYTYLDARDTTTWTGRIEGNPVRLVE